jgi:DNA-3-methyladenine glycosylase
MLNVVTGPVGHPAAVLIRAAGDITGPARLTRVLAIDGGLNGHAAGPGCGLWFEAGNPAGRVKATARIGVEHAGPHWSSRKLRFLAVDAHA